MRRVLAILVTVVPLVATGTPGVTPMWTSVSFETQQGVTVHAKLDSRLYLSELRVEMNGIETVIPSWAYRGSGRVNLSTLTSYTEPGSSYTGLQWKTFFPPEGGNRVTDYVQVHVVVSGGQVVRAELLEPCDHLESAWCLRESLSNPEIQPPEGG